MNNIFTKDDIRFILKGMQMRCEAARHAGGISKEDEFNGTVIPKGWHFDVLTQYWLPPNVDLK